MTNPLENDCENTNTHTHGGVHLVVLAHLQRRKKLELKQINSTKKRRPKEVIVSDRTLASAGPMRLVKWLQRARGLGHVTGRWRKE